MRTGIAAGGGVVVGSAFVLARRGPVLPLRRVRGAEIDAEVQRLRRAVEASRQELETVRAGLSAEHQHDCGLLLDAHLLMHRDELVVDAAVGVVRDRQINAEWALRRTLDALQSQLRGAGSAYFRERAHDVEQVGQHIFRHLLGTGDAFPALSPRSIVVADDLTPADAARLLSLEVGGLVVERGTGTSHTAILARALDVPVVVGCDGIVSLVDPGDRLIVDGLRGAVVVNPSDDEAEEAETRGTRYRTFTKRLQSQRDTPAETLDGVPVDLSANVELPAEVALALAAGASGIGLYRTEFLYLDRREPPSENEQARVYSDVVQIMEPRAVTFRTCDMGGDKLPYGRRARQGGNPSLGLRAIRWSLAEPELFCEQVRAILRAAVHGPVRLMLPLVSSVGELRRAKELVHECVRDLERRGVDHTTVPLGMMLEVPAAVLMAETLAEGVDFFSIGTNDLVQYCLARDRGDPDVAAAASPLDPAVLRLLSMAVRAAHKSATPISMCGDMASDPISLPVVLGLGLRSLSVPIAFLGIAREIVRRIDGRDARRVAEEALTLEEAGQVRELVVRRFAPSLGDLWEEQGLDVQLGA